MNKLEQLTESFWVCSKDYDICRAQMEELVKSCPMEVLRSNKDIFTKYPVDSFEFKLALDWLFAELNRVLNSSWWADNMDLVDTCVNSKLALIEAHKYMLAELQHLDPNIEMRDKESLPIMHSAVEEYAFHQKNSRVKFICQELINSQ